LQKSAQAVENKRADFAFWCWERAKAAGRMNWYQESVANGPHPPPRAFL
jgi:hypothetical protein